MFEHLYGYEQPEQQQPRSQSQSQQQQTNQSKQLQSYGDGSYDYGNSLDEVPSTSTLPAFAFLSQHSGLASQLHLQEPQQFNGFSHDFTPNNDDSNSGTGTYSMNRRSTNMDDQTSAFSQYNTFESLEHHDITDVTFSMPQLYHHPVDISTIAHNPVIAVPDLPMTLPPLHSPTAPQQPSTTTPTTSILPSDNLPASKKQRLARGFRERAPWTPEEDNLLRLAVQLYGDKTEKWAKIAECVQGRTNKNCRKRWFHSLDPSLRKGAWTDDEDRLLREGVKKFPNQWSKIADRLEGRTDDQCAKRWRESLDPSIDRSDWTQEEDIRLASKFEELGSQWQKIAQYFDGRPGLHCRNRWRKLQRVALIKKEKERSSLYLSSCATKSTLNTAIALPTMATSGIIGKNDDNISGDTLHEKAGNDSTTGHAEPTSLINMGHEEAVIPRFHHQQLSNVSSAAPASFVNRTNSISAPSTPSISALVSTTSSPSSSPSLSSPSSSSSSSLSSSSISPSSSPPVSSALSTRSVTGNNTSSKSNSSLPTLLQPQTFHTTSRPQNTTLSSTSLSTATNATTINTTFDTVNDRRQQDYEVPEPLGHLNPYGCDVPGCLASFSQSSELFYHMKNVHPDLTKVTKPYRCAVVNCSKKYKNINGLQYHLRDAKGISSHTIVSSPSSPLKISNGIHHREIIIPAIGNNGTIEKNMDDSPIVLPPGITSPPTQPLHTLPIGVINSNDMIHGRSFSCPMIGCKDAFETISDLKLHQDQNHSNPFQLAAITALTNPLVESCLLEPIPHSLGAPAMAISSSATTCSSIEPPPTQQQQQQQQLQQQQQQNRNQNQFRVRREKWIMKSV